MWRQRREQGETRDLARGDGLPVKARGRDAFLLICTLASMLVVADMVSVAFTFTVQS